MPKIYWLQLLNCEIFLASLLKKIILNVKFLQLGLLVRHNEQVSPWEI